MKKPSIEELKWTRIFTPLHIPKYLVEQIRDKDFSIEEFYKYHELNCALFDDGKMKLNPFSHLYTLVDDDYVVKGFLWFVIDPLSKDIVIQNFSVDKEFWFKGKCVSKLAKHIKDIRKKGNLNKIYWITNYPKHSERYGFKRSKGVLMEYTEEKENGANSTRGNPNGSQCAVINRAAEELPEPSSRELCATSG